MTKVLFLSVAEAHTLGYKQKQGIDILVENKNVIINPSNWYWIDNNKKIKARCYFNEINLGE